MLLTALFILVSFLLSTLAAAADPASATSKPRPSDARRLEEEGSCELKTATGDVIAGTFSYKLQADAKPACTDDELEATMAKLAEALLAEIPTEDELDGGVTVKIDVCAEPGNNNNNNDDRRGLSADKHRNLRVHWPLVFNWEWFFRQFTARCIFCDPDDDDRNYRRRAKESTDCGCHTITPNSSAQTFAAEGAAISSIALSEGTTTVEVTHANKTLTMIGGMDGEHTLDLTEVATITANNGIIEQITYCGPTCPKTVEAFQTIELPKIERTITETFKKTLDAVAPQCLLEVNPVIIVESTLGSSSAACN